MKPDLVRSLTFAKLQSSGRRPATAERPSVGWKDQVSAGARRGSLPHGPTVENNSCGPTLTM